MISGEWKTKEDILRDFCVIKDEDNNINILFAYYECPPYEGYAFVLFKQDGKLYTVTGSHCSCFGLEYQWEPVETTVKTLRMMFEKGTIGQYYGVDYYKKDMLKIIESLEKKDTTIEVERLEII